MENKSLKVTSSASQVRKSLSNRTPDERVSFSYQDENEESNIATFTNGSVEIVAKEILANYPEKTEEAYKKLARQSKEADLLFESKHQESNIGKPYMS